MFTDKDTSDDYFLEKHKHYMQTDRFVNDMRKGCLKQGFTLSERTFLEISCKINMDKEFAREISDNSILILLAAKGGSEVDGLVVMAEMFGKENDNG